MNIFSVSYIKHKKNFIILLSSLSISTVLTIPTVIYAETKLFTITETTPGTDLTSADISAQGWSSMTGFDTGNNGVTENYKSYGAILSNKTLNIRQTDDNGHPNYVSQFKPKDNEYYFGVQNTGVDPYNNSNSYYDIDNAIGLSPSGKLNGQLNKKIKDILLLDPSDNYYPYSDISNTSPSYHSLYQYISKDFQLKAGNLYSFYWTFVPMVDSNFGDLSTGFYTISKKDGNVDFRMLARGNAYISDAKKLDAERPGYQYGTIIMDRHAIIPWTKQVISVDTDGTYRIGFGSINGNYGHPVDQNYLLVSEDQGSVISNYVYSDGSTSNNLSTIQVDLVPVNLTPSEFTRLKALVEKDAVKDISANLVTLSNNTNTANLTTLAVPATTTNLTTLAVPATTANLTDLSNNKDNLVALAPTAVKDNLLTLANNTTTTNLTALATPATTTNLTTLAVPATTTNLTTLAVPATTTNLTTLASNKDNLVALAPTAVKDNLLTLANNTTTTNLTALATPATTTNLTTLASNKDNLVALADNTVKDNLLKLADATTNTNLTTLAVPATTTNLTTLAVPATTTNLTTLATPATTANLTTLAVPATTTNLTTLAAPATTANLTTLASNKDNLVALAPTVVKDNLLTLANATTTANLTTLATPATTTNLTTLAVPATTTNLTTLAAPATTANLTTLAVPATTTNLTTLASNKDNLVALAPTAVKDNLLTLANNTTTTNLTALATPATTTNLTTLASNKDNLVALAPTTVKDNLLTLANNTTTTNLTTLAVPATTTNLTTLANATTTTNLTALATPATTANLTTLAAPATTTNLTTLAAPATTTNLTDLSNNKANLVALAPTAVKDNLLTLANATTTTNLTALATPATTTNLTTLASNKNPLSTLASEEPSISKLANKEPDLTELAIRKVRLINLADNGITINNMPEHLEELSKENVTKKLLFFASGMPQPNTLLSTSLNRRELRSVFNNQSSFMNDSLRNDCNSFDTKGACLSLGGRYNIATKTDKLINDSSESIKRSNNTSGSTIAAFSLNDDIRLGAWLDQNISIGEMSSIKQSNGSPVYGIYGSWNNKFEGEGLEIRASAGTGSRDIKISRVALDSVEAGVGEAKIRSQAASIIFNYGKRLGSILGSAYNSNSISNSILLSPYGGVTYLNTSRSSYTENTNIVHPLSYDKIKQETTSTLFGVKATASITDGISLYGAGGAEYDIKNSVNEYSGSSANGKFSTQFAEDKKKLRPVVSAGVNYNINSNQFLGFSVSYRQEPLSDPDNYPLSYDNDQSKQNKSNNSNTSFLLNYQIGF